MEEAKSALGKPAALVRVSPSNGSSRVHRTYPPFLKACARRGCRRIECRARWRHCNTGEVGLLRRPHRLRVRALPFVAAAKALLAEGRAPETEIAMRHKGSTIIATRCKIGILAAITEGPLPPEMGSDHTEAVNAQPTISRVTP